MNRPFTLTVIVLVNDAEILKLFHEVESEDGEFVVLCRNGKSGRKIFGDPIDRRNLLLQFFTALFNGRAFAIRLRVYAYVFEARMHCLWKIVHTAVEHKRTYLLIL